MLLVFVVGLVDRDIGREFGGIYRSRSFGPPVSSDSICSGSRNCVRARQGVFRFRATRHQTLLCSRKLPEMSMVTFGVAVEVRLVYTVRAVQVMQVLVVACAN